QSRLRVQQRLRDELRLRREVDGAVRSLHVDVVVHLLQSADGDLYRLPGRVAVRVVSIRELELRGDLIAPGDADLVAPEGDDGRDVDVPVNRSERRRSRQDGGTRPSTRRPTGAGRVVDEDVVRAVGRVLLDPARPELAGRVLVDDERLAPLGIDDRVVRARTRI